MAGIKYIFGLVCEDVRFEVNGKISIIGEGNIFNLPRIPLTIPLCILTKWSGPPTARGMVALKMLSPDSAAPVRLSLQELQLGETDPGTCFGGTINKIHWQVHTTGVHLIQIFLDDEEVGQLELMIKKVEPA